jgi:hypothetical protein
MKSLLLVKSFDLHSSNQYILVRVVPCCFRFAKMCLCQVSLLSKCSPRYLISSSWGSCMLFIRTRRHTSLLMVNVTWTNLDPLAFILHFLNQFWTASRLVCSFCEAIAESLPVATTAVSSAKVTVADYCEVHRSAVYSRYNNDSRILPALTGQSSVYSVSTLIRKCQICK